MSFGVRAWRNRRDSCSGKSGSRTFSFSSSSPLSLQVRWRRERRDSGGGVGDPDYFRGRLGGHGGGGGRVRLRPRQSDPLRAARIRFSATVSIEHPPFDILIKISFMLMLFEELELKKEIFSLDRC